MKKEIDGTTIKDVRNLLRVGKEIDETAVKDRNIFLDWKKENKAIKE